MRKCTQVGISFSTLLKILYLGDQENISAVYTLPTGGDVKDFVVSKFDPVVENSELLKVKVRRDPFSRRAVFSTALKRIGGSHYFFRGSWTEAKAQAIDADVVVIDELDFQKPDIRKMYEERTTGAGSKDFIYWIGIPSLPNYGISELYEQSDQREWYVRCPECGKLQTLEFPANISFKKKTFICKYCRKDLPDDARREGVWIAKYPGRKIHGYYFNRLMAPWIPATRIIKSYHDDKPKHFHNFTLGLPYLEKTLQFRKEELQDSYMFEDEFERFKKERVVCGIDQGNRFHLIAGFANAHEAVGTQARVYTKTGDLERALETLRPDLILMDMFPDQHYARELQKRFGLSRFVLVNLRLWSEAARMKEFIDYKRQEGVVNLERTESLDNLYSSIRKGKMRLYSSMSGLQELYQHLKNLVPDFQERYGKKRKVYRKIGKEDFAHALNYFLTGCNILFPNISIHPTQIIPASIIKSPSRGTREWFEDDLSRRAREISGHPDIILIPPKSF